MLQVLWPLAQAGTFAMVSSQSNNMPASFCQKEIASFIPALTDVSSTLASGESTTISERLRVAMSERRNVGEEEGN